jgi:hypothetical protein
VVGSGDFILEGEVKRSVTIFSSVADVSGNVGRELTMAGGSLTLTDTARVGGNLTAHATCKRFGPSSREWLISGKEIDQTKLPLDLVEFRLGIEFLLDPAIPFET